MFHYYYYQIIKNTINIESLQKPNKEKIRKF